MIPPLTNVKECRSGTGHNFRFRSQSVVEQVHNVSSYTTVDGRVYMTVETDTDPFEHEDQPGQIMRVECADCDISLPVTGAGIRTATGKFAPCEIIDAEGFTIVETD